MGKKKMKKAQAEEYLKATKHYTSEIDRFISFLKLSPNDTKECYEAIKIIEDKLSMLEWDKGNIDDIVFIDELDGVNLRRL